MACLSQQELFAEHCVHLYEPVAGGVYSKKSFHGHLALIARDLEFSLILIR